jgi:hypothetical protein
VVGRHRAQKNAIYTAGKVIAGHPQLWDIHKVPPPSMHEQSCEIHEQRLIPPSATFSSRFSLQGKHGQSSQSPSTMRNDPPLPFLFPNSVGSISLPLANFVSGYSVRAWLLSSAPRTSCSQAARDTTHRYRRISRPRHPRSTRCVLSRRKAQQTCPRSSPLWPRATRVSLPFDPEDTLGSPALRVRPRA